MKKVGVLVLAVLMIVSVTSLVAANPGNGGGPDAKPGGPWIHPNQHVSLDSIIQPEELEEELQAIEDKAIEGRMELEKVGESAFYDHPIYVAKFGEPGENEHEIFIDTQIHGDEIHGTHAVLNLIREFATSNQPEVEMILDNVTVWFLPMINPDGGTIFEIDEESTPDWYDGAYGDATSRQNVQPWEPEEYGLDEDTDAPWYYSESTSRDWAVCGTYDGIGGYDINRDSHPNLEYDLPTFEGEYRDLDDEDENWGGEPGFRVTPEARAVRDAFAELEPDFYINHHHMGTRAVDDEMTTLEIQAQFVPFIEEEDRDPEEPGVFEAPWVDKEDNYYYLAEETLDLSNQVNYLVYEYLTENYGESHFGHVTQYPRVEDFYGGYGLPGTTLGSHSMSAAYDGGRDGAGTMLYEVRGQQDPWTHTGQKGSGMQIRQSEAALYETLRAFATGEVFDIDPDKFEEEVPEAGYSPEPPFPTF